MRLSFALLATLAALSLAACEDRKSAEAPEQPAPGNAAPVAPAAPSDAPPTVNGVYVQHNTCPGEGCTFDFYWRATVSVPLHETADDNSKIVATIAPKENVQALTGDYSVAPVRGVAQRDLKGLIDGNNQDVEMKKGDVVFLLGDAGEGTFDAWYEGKLMSTSLDFPLDALALDTKLEDRPRSVWWVQLKRASGQTGWVRDPKDFDCKDLFSGDQGCVAVKKTP